MANNNLIDHFQKRGLISQISEELKEPKTFLMSTFVNATEEFASDVVDLDIYKGKRRVAAYVKRAEQGQFVNAIGYSTKTFSPPYLKPKIAITPEDIQKRAPGGQIYDPSGDLSSSVSDYMARQINDLDMIITRNEELQAMQALFDGKITARDINGNILAEIDYGRDVDLIQTLGTKWDASGSDKLQDLRTYRRKITQKSGFTANIVLMGADAADEFLADEVLQRVLSKDWSARGNLAFDMRENGGVWLGTADGFDFWTYEEWIIDPADSVEKALIPAKKVLLASSNARFSRIYGSIAAEKDGQLVIQATARYIDMYGSKDPAASIVQIHSAPLIVTNHPDAYATLTVLS